MLIQGCWLNMGCSITVQDCLSGGAIWEDRCVSGLVIDDFFCISSERTSTPRDEAASVLQFVTAKQVYKEEGLVGSDDKDIIGEDRFKVVGAEVVSDIPTVRRGAVVVGAPFQKRLGLGLVSALVAQSPSNIGCFACYFGGLMDFSAHF